MIESFEDIYRRTFKPKKLTRKEVDALVEPYRLSIPISGFEDIEYDIFEPQTYQEYVGQDEAKEILRIISQAAEKEQRRLPNILITGSAGLGKTTLSKILLKDKEYVFVDGSSVNATYNDLRGYAIIDEIHNVKPEVCDSLNVILDQSVLRIIGCTTNPGMLPSPFRSRFRTISLSPYSVTDLVHIMQNVLNRKKSININNKFLFEVAIRGRQTPRTALRILSFLMDMMIVNGNSELSEETFIKALDMMGLDSDGLLPIDRRYLAAFPESGQAVGLQYLSAVTGIDKETIEEEIEPFLMQLKRLNRTSKGRILVQA